MMSLNADALGSDCWNAGSVDDGLLWMRIFWDQAVCVSRPVLLLSKLCSKTLHKWWTGVLKWQPCTCALVTHLLDCYCPAQRCSGNFPCVPAPLHPWSCWLASFTPDLLRPMIVVVQCSFTLHWCVVHISLSYVIVCCWIVVASTVAQINTTLRHIGEMRWDKWFAAVLNTICQIRMNKCKVYHSKNITRQFWSNCV